MVRRLPTTTTIYFFTFALFIIRQRPQTGGRKLSFLKKIFNQRTSFKILICLNLVTLRFLHKRSSLEIKCRIARIEVDYSS